MKDNQLKAFIHEIENTSELKEVLESGDSDFLNIAKQSGFTITNKEMSGFLSEMRHLTQEDKTNMPPLVVLIMAYLNIIFPDYDKQQNL